MYFVILFLYFTAEAAFRHGDEVTLVRDEWLQLLLYIQLISADTGPLPSLEIWSMWHQGDHLAGEPYFLSHLIISIIIYRKGFYKNSAVREIQVFQKRYDVLYTVTQNSI